MARIPTYELDQVFDDNDLLLGTDGATSALTTKNFSLAGLAEYVIDKLIDPDATSFCIPVFRDPADTQGANATRITSSIIQQNTYPNGSNISISGTLDAIKKIQVKGNGSVAGQLELNCEQNSHGVTIQAPPHSAGASYTMILPVDMGTSGKQLTTDGTSQLYWADPEDDNLDIIADVGTGSIDLDTQALTISGGTLINTSVNPNGGQEVIVTHGIQSRTDTANQIGLNFGDTFDAETSITTDQSQHVQAVNTTTYTLPANPVPSDNVTGTGTATKIPIWNGSQILGDSNITQDNNGLTFTIGGLNTTLGNSGNLQLAGQITTGNATGGASTFSGNVNVGGLLNVGTGAGAGSTVLDVKEKATIRGGLVVSEFPGGVTVDNTSVVIGAGNNDIITGSDHCLAVGNNNQITNNSDNSVAFGQGNTLNEADASLVAGLSNTITGASGITERSAVVGFSNTLQGYASAVYGGSNTVEVDNNAFVLGFDHDVIAASSDSIFVFGEQNVFSDAGTNANVFMIGADLVGSDGTMVLGYRNDKTLYPSEDNSKGLGETKFVVSVGSADNTSSNALLITEGGVNKANTLQIPRVILPTVPTFSASNDAAAAALGVPEGALYQNNGVVQINRGGGSTTDPLAGGITQTTGTYTPQLIANTPSEWVISSYSIQQGKWVRTGNMVFCDFTIIINASSISGNTGGTSGLTIQGWPYDHDGGAGSFQGGALNQCDGFDVPSAGSNVTLNSGLGNAKLNITKQNAAITNYFVTQSMKTGDLNNGNQVNIKGSFSYLTTDSAALNSGATIDS